MKLSISHIAPYLPHQLQVYHSGGLIVPMTIEPQKDWKNNGFGINEVLSYHYLKPLFLPMSSLYTEMEDGTVPIVELFKMLCTEDDPYESFHIRLMSDCIEIRDNEALFYFEEGAFRYTIEEKIDGFIPNQIDLFTYLFENHFDVFGLIDKGLAIDKTKIK